jgi:hypothetical protein
MTRQSQDTFRNELFAMLTIIVVVAGLTCVLAASGTSITFSPFKTVGSTLFPICNTSVRCVTVPKLQKRIAPERRETGSSPKLMASLNPSGNLSTRNVSAQLFRSGLHGLTSRDGTE